MAFSVEKFATEMYKRVLPLIEELKNDWETDKVRINEYADNLIRDIDNLHILCPKTPKKTRSIKRPVITSDDEAQSTTARSISPVFSETNSNKSSIGAKSKRNASKLAQQKINDITQMKLNSKLRRPGVSDKENMNSTMMIKQEKTSLLPNPEGPGTKSILTDTTSNLEMPPPAPKTTKQRKKKIKKEKPESSSEDEPLVRVTRSKRPIKKELIPPEIIIRRSNRSTRQTTDSDVIIQEAPILSFDISDSDDDVPLINRLEVVSKKQAVKTKDKIAVDVVPEITNSIKEISLYEDACSDVNNTKPNETITLPAKQLDVTLSINNKKALADVDLNLTHIINKNKQSNKLDTTHILNKNMSDQHQSLEAQLKENGVKDCTVLLENIQNAPKTTTNPIVAPDLTDDDESIEVPPPTKKIRPKPMFSPYANSPVKKRVAAFEKLGTDPPVDIPTRITRTKSRKDAADTKESRLPVQNKFTPIFNNHLPSFIPQSDSRVYRLQNLHNTVQKSNNHSQINNYVSLKSATAVKPTKIELQERREAEQKVRFEKEDEVRRKKDALLQEKAEERRKRREEKQERAQKAREAKEKEKEDKLRQFIQEKEDRLEKEEKQRKEWAAKNAAKAEEKRKLEEQVRRAKIREIEARKKLEEERRAKLAIKPPPLPTDDCDSSDCESEAPEPRKKVLGPDWGRRENLLPVLLAHRHIPNAVIDTFFQVHAQTPDLRQIFETIDERQLRRNSSAIWNTPPRYSKLPKF